MRGFWAPSDLAKQAVSEWTLLPGDRIRIHQALAVRLLESAPPVVVTADADAAADVSAQ